MKKNVDFFSELTTGGDARLTPARGDLAAAHLEGIVEAEHYVAGRSHEVTTFTAPLFVKPSDDGPLLTELLYGEAFEVYDQKDGWAWGQSGHDYYVGYTPLSSLAPAREIGQEAGCTVTATVIDAYREPDIKSPILARYPMHARLAPAGSETVGDYRFLKVENGAWVRADLVFEWDLERRPWPLKSDYLLLARSFLGTPYRWGGRTVLGLDCSGLLQIACVARLRDTDLQEREIGLRAIDVTDLPPQRGDIVFFPGHVGIMVDEKGLLHANARKMCLSIDPLSSVIERLAHEHDQPVRAVYRLPDGTKL
ncbi:MAG: C40 family peptidase [Proteobacteria bacterium]|nr:C40 family peptidase [Pseudomonadota bacterium]